jgi:hypothetical protein
MSTARRGSRGTLNRQFSIASTRQRLASQNYSLLLHRQTANLTSAATAYLSQTPAWVSEHGPDSSARLANKTHFVLPAGRLAVERAVTQLTGFEQAASVTYVFAWFLYPGARLLPNPSQRNKALPVTGCAGL